MTLPRSHDPVILCSADESVFRTGVAAIIVLYCPKIDLLERLLGSLIDQVDRVIIVDNTLKPDVEIRKLVERFATLDSYIALDDNLGIATAQNIGIRRSLSEGYSHVLLLDQDSVLPPKMVESLLLAEANLLSIGVGVAAVGPQFIDEKSGKPVAAIRHHYFRIQRLYLDPKSTDPFETDHLIASGSIIRASVLQRVGLMRDDFFIDWVDIEWGMRARSMGYKSFYVPSVVMKHSVGDSVVTVLGRDMHQHTDLRNYYMLRNAVFLFRLNSMGWKWKINFAPRIPVYLILYPWFSKDRLNNIKLTFRALFDGLRGQLGKLGQA
jgi:rhamnosyltransferase